MKLHLLFVLFGCGLAWFVLSSRSGGLGNVSNQDRSGSPVSIGQCSNCHSGGSFNAQSTITVKDGGGNAVTSYIPGNSYVVEIAVSGVGNSSTPNPEYGSQLSVLDASNSNAGTFGSTITANTQVSTVSGRSLLEHSGVSSTGVFQANWVAPTAGSGTITLYGNGVVVNGALNTGGDQGSAVVSLSLTEAVATTISYGQSSYCIGGSDPTPTQTGTSGGSYSSTSGLIINGTSGLIDLSASTPGSYTITYTYSGGNTTTNITVNSIDQANISYPVATYCENDLGNVSVTLTGTTGGSFSSSAGLAINTNSGAIDLANSQAGNYSISYSTNGACPTTTNTNFTISSSSDASFSYAAAGFCLSDPNNPGPNITGTTGGTFAGSNNGIEVNSNTGVIDLSISNPGTYNVSYVVGGSCPDSQSVSVTITAAGDASFNYDVGIYCSDDVNPIPDITGTGGGSFSTSSPNLIINNSTGEVDLANSSAGSYSITYALGGTCSDTQSVNFELVTVDSAGLSYTDTIYCLNGSNPLAIATGVPGGSFASTPTTGITINSTTGEIDLANSISGTYTIEYNTTGICPNTAFFEVELQVCGALDAHVGNILEIFPNPSQNGIFQFKLEDYSIIDNYQVYNAVGQLVRSGDWSNQKQLDLSEETKGVYIIHLISIDKKVSSYKLIYR